MKLSAPSPAGPSPADPPAAGWLRWPFGLPSFSSSSELQLRLRLRLGLCLLLVALFHAELRFLYSSSLFSLSFSLFRRRFPVNSFFFFLRQVFSRLIVKLDASVPRKLYLSVLFSPLRHTTLVKVSGGKKNTRFTAG